MSEEEFAVALKTPPTLTLDQFKREMRAAFPGESEDDLMGRLWSHSAYPCAGENWDLYLKQIKRAQEVVDSGATPCDGCGEPVDVERSGFCRKCRARLGWEEVAAGRSM